MFARFPYVLLALVALCFSCRENATEREKQDETASAVSNFSWISIKETERKAKAAQLKQLLTRDDLAPITRFKIFNDLCAYSYVYEKDYTQAARYAVHMVETIESNNLEHRESQKLSLAYYSKGDALFALGDYDLAFTSYFRAKTLLAVNRDLCNSGDYSYRLGMVLFKQGNFRNSAAYFKSSFEETKDCPQNFPVIFRQQEVLANIAECYVNLKLKDSTLIAAKKAIQYINLNDTTTEHRNSFEMARAVVYGSIGRIQIHSGNYGEGEKYLLKSIAINSRQHFDNGDAAKMRLRLSELYLKNHSVNAAGEQLNAVGAVLAKLKHPEIKSSYHQLYAEFLTLKGNHKDAYLHLSAFVRLNDSLQHQINNLRATNLNERFRNLASEDEIGYLKKETEQQTKYLIAAIVFSVMALIIVLLIYFFWRKSNHNLQELTELNNQINEQKKQLQNVVNELEKSGQEKDGILRTVAHDLRNPIGGISSLVSLIMLEDNLSKEDLETHRIIKDASDNALSLINDLIKASENTKEEYKEYLQKENVDLVGLISDVVELLKFKAKAKDQEILIGFSEGKVLVHVDREHIYRVISNLVSNAIKFSYPKSVIEVKLSIVGAAVKVEVVDHGIGVPENMQNNIFEVFTKSKRMGTQGEKSYGLGLSISKQIIMAHNGLIGVRNNEDKGSTFYFSLPIAN